MGTGRSTGRSRRLPISTPLRLPTSACRWSDSTRELPHGLQIERQRGEGTPTRPARPRLAAAVVCRVARARHWCTPLDGARSGRRTGFGGPSHSAATDVLDRFARRPGARDDHRLRRVRPSYRQRGDGDPHAGHGGELRPHCPGDISGSTVRRRNAHRAALGGITEWREAVASRSCSTDGSPREPHDQRGSTGRSGDGAVVVRHTPPTRG